MIYSVPIAGYFLLVLIIMFGGRNRRPFNVATQKAAGMIVTSFALTALVWLIVKAIVQISGAY
jgi:predicted CDP-diglyceride synthetase/phosphatidate cytidylyltransferase